MSSMKWYGHIRDEIKEWSDLTEKRKVLERKLNEIEVDLEKTKEIVMQIFLTGRKMDITDQISSLEKRIKYLDQTIEKDGS